MVTDPLESRNSCRKCYDACCQFLSPFPLSNDVMLCLTGPSNPLSWLSHERFKLSSIFHHSTTPFAGRFLQCWTKLWGRLMRCDWFSSWSIKGEKVCGGWRGKWWWWWCFQGLEGVGPVAFVKSVTDWFIKGHTAVGGTQIILSFRRQILWLLKDLS